MLVAPLSLCKYGIHPPFSSHGVQIKLYFAHPITTQLGTSFSFCFSLPGQRELDDDARQRKVACSRGTTADRGPLRPRGRRRRLHQRGRMEGEPPRQRAPGGTPPPYKNESQTTPAVADRAAGIGQRPCNSSARTIAGRRIGTASAGPTVAACARASGPARIAPSVPSPPSLNVRALRGR